MPEVGGLTGRAERHRARFHVDSRTRSASRPELRESSRACRRRARRRSAHSSSRSPLSGHVPARSSTTTASRRWPTRIPPRLRGRPCARLERPPPTRARTRRSSLGSASMLPATVALGSASRSPASRSCTTAGSATARSRSRAPTRRSGRRSTSAPATSRASRSARIARARRPRPRARRRRDDHRARDVHARARLRRRRRSALLGALENLYGRVSGTRRRSTVRSRSSPPLPRRSDSSSLRVRCR